MKILFIGNSHTYVNDLPYVLRSIAEASGEKVSVCMLAHGGVGLEYHASGEEAPFNIRYGGFDTVVLQHRAHPFEGEEPLLFEGGGKLCALAKNAGAKCVFYMPWAELARPQALEGMHKAYAQIARRTSSALAPCGEAFRLYAQSHDAALLYGPDGQHASPLGTALAAYTIFSALYERAALPRTGEEELALIAFRAAVEEKSYGA